MRVEVAPEVKHRAVNAEWIARGCGTALLLYGIFLRGWIYLQNYSLNHDEAALALNLLHRSSSELMRPLDYLQAAPFGFLLIEHAIVRLGGTGERALRLFPLLCSVAALLVFWEFLRRRLGGWPQVFAIGFLAVSQDLAMMSPRVKQYSAEVLATTLLLFVGTWLVQETTSRRELWASALLGALLPWFAFSAVFVIAGIGTVCVLLSFQRREMFSRYLPVFAIWAASIGVLLLAIKELGGAREGLIRFWTPNFLPVLSPASILPWLGEAMLSFGASVMSVRLAPLAVIALCAGVIIALHARDRFRAALVASIAWCLAASALQQYPFTGRFLFFLVPAALVLMAQALADLRPGHLRKAVLAVVGIAISYASVSAAKNLMFSPKASEDDPRAVLMELTREWQPGDKIYLSSGATPPFLYYEDRLGLARADSVTGRVAASYTWGPVFTEFPSADRVWFFYLPPLDGDFDRQAMERAGKAGRELAYVDRGFYAAKLVGIGR